MNLLTFLESNNDVRKIFGEKELKIIEKQLYGINLTQSERNRLSRDIRKKFEIIKEASRFSNEFELKKGAIIKNIIAKTKDIILDDEELKNIKKIILYGSAVENKLTFRSDIDVAVEFFDTNLKKSTLFRKRILGKANSRADIQVFNSLPDKIKKEILERGRVIYEKI